ncbi:hypothetical protein [Streptomyces harbinensis]|uniref:hypothetical protein n=1 Tax=Streptomyces harbinensis TaxID=1176198 RepID=UPI003F6A2F09
MGGASSHLLAALARADALIEIPEAATTAEAGAELTVVPLGGGGQEYGSSS